MSSINTNASAMNALATLRNINDSLTNTQSRVSTGLKVQSGKDNAAYFAISETMKGDSGMLKAVDEGLSLTKSVVATARLGAETVTDLAREFVKQVAFSLQEGVDTAKVQEDLDGIVSQMTNTVNQSSFNGTSLLKTASTDVTATTGVTRDGGTFATSTTTISAQDVEAIVGVLGGLDLTTSTDIAADLVTAEAELAKAITASTSLGVSEKTLETQSQFLKSLTEQIDGGVGSMVDANMEEEAARLQALQVQQQLATQSLSIANQAPQNILSLFR